MKRTLKSLILMTIVGALALMSVAAVVAQDDETEDVPDARPPMASMIRPDGVVRLALEETGLTLQEFMQAVRDSESIAAVIEANDGDVDAVINAAVEQMTARINQAVENGYLTEEEADARLEDLTSHITDVINGEAPLRSMLGEMRGRGGFGGRDGFRDRPGFGGRGGFGDRPGFGGPRGGMFGGGMIQLDLAGIIEDATGLTQDEIREAVRAGSLADLLAENDVDVDALIDDVMTELETRLDERTSDMLERLEDGLRDRLNGADDTDEASQENDDTTNSA